MAIKIPKSQKKWIGSAHYSLQYDGNARHIQILDHRGLNLKIKHEIASEILFLDKVKLGLSKLEVIKLLGEPFFIYEDTFKGADHTVFTYGLRSGSNKIKVETHFIENSFRLGTIYFLADFLNHRQINDFIMSKYLVSDYNLNRDYLTDKESNVVNLHIEQSYLIMNIYKQNSN